MRAFPSTSFRLVSDPIPESQGSVEITGIPKGRLVVASDAQKFQAHIRIYEVAPRNLGGGWTLISRCINGFRTNTPDSVHHILVEGSAISHFLAPGSRIGVEITALDMLEDSAANVIPYLLPANSYVLTSSGDPSYIEFGGPTVGVVEERKPDLPAAFTLEQNYPNPFNPSTVIRYRHSASGGVKLVVYDMLGREVRRLVDEYEPSGSHDVQFDASGLASGVYLYRLTAGTQSTVRRMVLVR
jgi:hypothetical protein